MRFTDFFIRRATTASMLLLAIVGFGVLSYLALPISNLPEVEYPIIQVSAVLRGANPDSMAETVATPLETEMSTIPGIEAMTSTNTAEQTQITLRFALNRNIDAAAQDVGAAIARAQGRLPTDMQAPPSYVKVNPAQDPILWLEMSSDILPLNEFAHYANDVFAKRLATVDGVSQVQVDGPQEPAFRIQVDPIRLAAYGLDLEQIRAAVGSSSAALPSGNLSGPTTDYSLQANTQLTTADQFGQIVVAYRNGVPLRLRQVATVINSTTDDKSKFWINGKPSIVLAILKQPGANTVAVADRLKVRIESLRGDMPPGVSFGKVADQANTVRDSIAEVNRTLLLTIGLVVLVVALFLGTLSSTLVAALAIPTSVLGAFCVMWMLGYSIDLFSMLAITLSIGFVVDDAIVMIENVASHQAMGKGRARAALDGAREVAFTIISMTVSLLAVFLPILFLNGVLGRLLREFAVTISAAILVSGITSLVLTPMLCSRFLKENRMADGRLQRFSTFLYQQLEDRYKGLLLVVLRHRRSTLFASFALAVFTAFLLIEIPKSFMPTVDVGSINGLVEASQDNSYERMTSYAEAVNAVLSKTPWIESHLSGTTAANIAWFHINLQSNPQRPNVKVIMAQLQNRLRAISGISVSLRQGDFLSVEQSESRAQYSAALQGPDAAQVYRWAPQIEGKLQSLAELSNVTSDLRMEAPRIGFDIRRDRARLLNIQPGDIANTIYDAFGNRSIGTVIANSERHNIILEVARSQQRNPEALQQLYLRSSTGALVSLSSLTVSHQMLAPASVHHIGQFPAVTFQFDLKPGVSLDRATAAIRSAAQAIGLPSAMSFTFQGTAAQFQSSLQGLGLLLLLAVLVIYLVLGMLYESFWHPLTIISGLPSAAVGALLILQVSGETLNLYSFLGVILLVGIVKKNAIMIVDFALAAERNEGLTPETAVQQGCLRRFRPIMMTTLAALLGAIPVALGTGIGGEARRPLGLAVVGGLLVSQVVTLFITPVFYLYLHGGRGAASQAESVSEKSFLEVV